MAVLWVIFKNCDYPIALLSREWVNIWLALVFWFWYGHILKWILVNLAHFHCPFPHCIDGEQYQAAQMAQAQRIIDNLPIEDLANIGVEISRKIAAYTNQNH
jgi:hypothetical protein